MGASYLSIDVSHSIHRSSDLTFWICSFALWSAVMFILYVVFCLDAIFSAFPLTCGRERQYWWGFSICWWFAMQVEHFSKGCSTMIGKTSSLFAILLLSAPIVFAQEVIPLYSGAAPGSEGWTHTEKEYFSPILITLISGLLTASLPVLWRINGRNQWRSSKFFCGIKKNI